jgi:hypothetical protein
MTEECFVRSSGICSGRVSSGGNGRGKLERIILGKTPQSEASLKWLQASELCFGSSRQSQLYPWAVK